MTYLFLEEDTIYSAMETNTIVSYHLINQSIQEKTILFGKTIFIDYQNKQLRLIEDLSNSIIYLSFDQILKITN